MKPEEAIDTINSIKHIIDIDNYSDRVEKALDMAIEALGEQRPHGEWKQVGEMTYRCTECGWLTKTCLIPYCQNCGSDNRKRGDKDVWRK